jgi:hypothetical protein
MSTSQAAHNTTASGWSASTWIFSAPPPPTTCSGSRGAGIRSDHGHEAEDRKESGGRQAGGHRAAEPPVLLPGP